MILGYILMMNVLPSVAFSSLNIVEPMKAMITHRTVQKFLEFKHDVEHLWTRSTPARRRSSARPQHCVYKLARHEQSLSQKLYRPELLRKKTNLTDVYPKRLIPVNTSKKGQLKMDKHQGVLLNHSFGRRYTFFPYGVNNLDDYSRRRYYFRFNQFPFMLQMPSVPLLNRYDIISTKKEGSRGRVISSAELDPNMQFNGTITLEIPKIMKTRQKREPGVIRVQIPYVKNILTYRSSYPRCLSNKKFWPLLGRYERPMKKKVEKRSFEISNSEAQKSNMKREVWPLLGPYNQVALSQETKFNDEILGQFAPALVSKRNNQMQLISKLSEMKAKEHIAEDNRLAEMHKTQEAKRDFQDRIAEQLDLLSEAKRADLRAKRAFEKVVKLERSLSEQDREIHRLKESEDELYEELLESEAEVAMADMQVIPKFISEEDLQEFMTGPKFT